MARPPITPVVVTPNGAYEAVRRSAAQGGCGIHGYPCVHPGEDLAAKKGTPVAAPHDGWILVSKATDAAPFSGYGPAVVLLAHDDRPDGAPDTEVAFRYSLLAHLDPSSLTYEQDLTGATLSSDSYVVLDVDGNEVHVSDPSAYTWALRAELPGRVQSLLGTWWRTPLAPGGRDSGGSLVAPYFVHEGEVLGYVGDAGHVHWEIRVQPFGLHADGKTIDPTIWLKHYDQPLQGWGTTTLPVDVSKNPDGPRATSFGKLVLVVAGVGAVWLATRKPPRRSRSRRRARR